MTLLQRARQLRRPAEPTRGVIAVETAICMPVVMAMFLGIVEMGRITEVSQVLNYATREGGRLAASGRTSSSLVQQEVIQYITDAGLPTQGVTVVVSDLTNPGLDPTAATPGDQILVQVTMPLNQVRWLTASVLSSPASALTSQSSWCSVRELQ